MNFAWVSSESNDDVNWLQNLTTTSDINTKNLEQLKDQINNNICYTIGINNNSTFSLAMKNSKCTSRRMTICRLNNTPENQKIIRPKFPCLPQSPMTRLKRSSSKGDNKFGKLKNLNNSNDKDVPNMDEYDKLEDEELSNEGIIYKFVK